MHWVECSRAIVCRHICSGITQWLQWEPWNTPQKNTEMSIFSEIFIIIITYNFVFTHYIEECVKMLQGFKWALESVMVIRRHGA